jgi:two-component system, NarL family, nitrate/nitrite response regulator NarL
MKSQVAPLNALRRPVEDHRPSSTMNGSPRRATSRIRIVIVDDHPIALAGLEALLSGERDLGVVARCVQTPVVLLATTNNQKLTEALSLDVQGIVFKHSDPRQLVRCLREVGAGRRWLDSTLKSYPDMVADGPVLDSLTRRQIEVARAAVSGLSNKELAQRLGVSEGTIKNHLHAIYERLRLDGRLALLLYLKEKALA